jgi:HEPN domain-containing protein
MADRTKEIRLFQRAADQRLTTAEFLFDHEFYLDAVYLAGYGVECALKSLILRRTARTEFAQMLARLTEAGAKGHDFEYLKMLLKSQLGGKSKTDQSALGEMAVHLGYVHTWSTDLRYQVGNLKPKDARRFMIAARQILSWCSRS